MAYRVLVVDDNHEVRRMIIASIQTLGAEIDILDVPSAEEAFVISATSPLDLVVIDFRLPGMTGLEMVNKLRKRKPGTKIILVTGVEDIAIRRQVADAGADAFFFKPIEINTFLYAVKHCLWGTTPLTSPHTAGKEAGATATAVSAESGRALKIPLAQEVKEAELESDEPSLIGRLGGLKRQLKAVAALLVNDAGQVVEEAGSAVDISTGSALLSALMHTFRASLKVSQAMAKGNSESLQYFAAPRQCIYVAPVGVNHALFVVTSGYLGPDKLGSIYHTIHLAIRDLQTLLEIESEKQKESEGLTAEIPANVTVDQETLAKVEEIFSKSPKSGDRQAADSFWETLEETGTENQAQGRDVLSYDQAHEQGLTSDENKGG